MKYARIQDDVLVFPQSREFPNIPNALTHDALLRSHGYMPLVGVPEHRKGYIPSPSLWHVVEQSETHTEPRQALEDIVQEVPVEGAPEGEEPQTELRVVGQRMVMRDTEVTTDTSYIQIDDWSYEPILEPSPVLPPPVHYSKYKLHLALEQAGLWDSVWSAITNAGYAQYWNDAQELSEDDPLFAAALASLTASNPGESPVIEITQEAIAQILETARI